MGLISDQSIDRMYIKMVQIHRLQRRRQDAERVLSALPYMYVGAAR